MVLGIVRFALLVGAGALGAVTRHGVHSAARRVAAAHVPEDDATDETAWVGRDAR